MAAVRSCTWFICGRRDFGSETLLGLLSTQVATTRICDLLAARGMQVNIDVECRFVQDILKGDDCYELRIKLKQHRDEKFPFNDDD